MRIASFEFTPAFWPTVAALVLVPFLSGLGVWQLSRAAEKEQRLQEYGQRNQAGIVNVDANSVFNTVSGYRQVRISGYYDSGHAFLLDNQVHNGVVGYHVFSPLRLDDNRLILVNRGWIPQGVSRNVLPIFSTPETEVTLLGVLSPAPGHGMLLGDDIQSNVIWPRVVQAIVLPRLSLELNTSLAPQILLLDPSESDGFVREWKIVQFGPERNRGYAFQWFMLAIAVLIIFIVVNTRRVNNVAKAGEL